MDNFPSFGEAGQSRLASQVIGQVRPLVIAHRGYSAIAPENTLPSFALALQAGADLVELDYYHSNDGMQVVFHDATLVRTTNAQKLWGDEGNTVGSRTWTDLRKLDSGSWFHQRYAGTPLLLLEEAVDAIQPQAITLIERKSGDPATLVAFLHRKNLVPGVVVQSFDWNFIRGCHEMDPQLILGCLGPPSLVGKRRLAPNDRFLNISFLDQVERTGARVVGWNDQVTESAIKEAHRRGLRVWIYVINDLDRARSLLEMGVDGLISDNPGLMWKALAVGRGEAKRPAV